MNFDRGIRFGFRVFASSFFLGFFCSLNKWLLIFILYCVSFFSLYFFNDKRVLSEGVCL